MGAQVAGRLQVVQAAERAEKGEQASMGRGTSGRGVGGAGGRGMRVEAASERSRKAGSAGGPGCEEGGRDQWSVAHSSLMAEAPSNALEAVKDIVSGTVGGMAQVAVGHPLVRVGRAEERRGE